MQYYENARPYAINLPARPGGGHVTLQPAGRGADVVEGSYYETYARPVSPPDSPALRKMDKPPEDMSRVAYSQTKREEMAKPVVSAAISSPAPSPEPEEAPDEAHHGEPAVEEQPQEPEQESPADEEGTEDHQDDTPPAEGAPASEDAETEEVEEPTVEEEEEEDDPTAAWVEANGNLSKTNLKKTGVDEVRELADLLGIDHSDLNKPDVIDAILNEVE